MSLIEDKILKLTKQLYPRSRGFKIINGSWYEKLHIALNKSEARAYADASSILNSILPDNDGFTADDATDWERRLGLISNPAVPLEDRKLAIKRKMNHPGTIKARQHYLYIQGQLQAAGFNVYVYENLSGTDIADFIVVPDVGELDEYELDEIELGDAISVYPDLFVVAELDTVDLGAAELNDYIYTNKVVNSIPESGDAFFNVGETLRSTFFIGGNPAGTFADVPLVRRDEFRQLILKLKPVQSVAYLLINYT